MPPPASLSTNSESATVPPAGGSGTPSARSGAPQGSPARARVVGRRQTPKRGFAYPTWLFGYAVGIGMGTLWGLGLAIYIH